MALPSAAQRRRVPRADFGIGIRPTAAAAPTATAKSTLARVAGLGSTTGQVKRRLPATLGGR